MNSSIGKRLLLTSLVGAILVTVMPTISAEPGVNHHVRKENSFRKNNRNYSNACELLSKKRMAKVKTSRRAKRDSTKWR